MKKGKPKPKPCKHIIAAILVVAFCFAVTGCYFTRDYIG